MKRKLLFLGILLLWVFTARAQQSSGTMPELELTGRITEGKNHQPVPYSTITLRHLADSTYFTGGIADSAGHFRIEKLKPGPYRIEVSFIGFDTYTDTIKLTPQNSLTDLGEVSLGNSGKNLDEVVITEEKDDFRLEIDKKVFQADKNAISTGGSALDVLRQVPTVNVDVDGKISLRGSENLTIFINGKPSGLTAQNRDQILQQIPASNIDRIELITNPSAKYDAEGMSGIINIITKKNIPQGRFGSINVGIGTYHKYNASFSYSFRNEKWTFTNTVGFRANRNFTNGYTTRINLFDSIPPYYTNQSNEGYRWGISPTLTGNIDYEIDKKNSLSLTYMFSYDNRYEADSIRYDFLDSAEWPTRLYYRNTEEHNNDFNIDGSLTYIHKFPKNNRELTTMQSVTYIMDNEVGNFRQNEYDLYSQPDTGFLPGFSNNYQYDRSLVSITQMDYVHPFAKVFKFETGGKVSIRRFDDHFIADTFSYAENRLIIDSVKTNRFIYLEDVNALYGTVSGSVKNFSFQAGLRIEQTNIWGDQDVGNLHFTKNYINFFPSVFLTYSIKKIHELQLSYSRRINRPWSGQLNPYPEYTDPLNLRKGNPDLNPENIDAVELTYSLQLKGHTFMTTGYFRYVNGIIQRYRTIDSLTSVSTVTFINLDYSMNFGLEVVARNRWFKWWTTTFNFNIYRNQMFGTSQTGELNATNFNYNIRFMSSWKMGSIVELQTSLFYMGPNTFPQGVMAEMWSLDAALKFSMLKDKLSITLNVSDIFNTRRFFITTYDDTFRGDVYRKRESRIGTIQIMYKFGNSQPTNNQRRRSGGNDGGMDMDMGM